MPTTWNDAVSAVADGVSSAMTTVTGSTLLLALSFGFLFLRKSIGMVKRFIKLGGKS